MFNKNTTYVKFICHYRRKKKRIFRNLCPLHNARTQLVKEWNLIKLEVREYKWLYTCTFWTTSLNEDDLCIHVFTRSIALSKFFTYSPYIFKNGASFWNISPSRGFMFLLQRGQIITDLSRNILGTTNKYHVCTNAHFYTHPHTRPGHFQSYLAQIYIWEMPWTSLRLYPFTSRFTLPLYNFAGKKNSICVW